MFTWFCGNKWCLLSSVEVRIVFTGLRGSEWYLLVSAEVNVYCLL